MSEETKIVIEVPLDGLDKRTRSIVEKRMYRIAYDCDVQLSLCLKMASAATATATTEKDKVKLVISWKKTEESPAEAKKMLVSRIFEGLLPTIESVGLGKAIIINIDDQTKNRNELLRFLSS